MSSAQTLGAAYYAAKQLEDGIQSSFQFTINSHKSLPQLQAILKSHEAALLTLAASVRFYQTLTLGSLAITILSGIVAVGSNNDNAELFAIVALVGGVITCFIGMISMVKSSNYTNYQYMTNCYVQLIEVKKLAAAPAA